MPSNPPNSSKQSPRTAYPVSAPTPQPSNPSPAAASSGEWMPGSGETRAGMAAPREWWVRVDASGVGSRWLTARPAESATSSPLRARKRISTPGKRRAWPTAGYLLLRCQQLLVRWVVPQRPERRVEVHHPAARIPLRERLLHQRDGRITLAQHRVDPRPPHRVSPVEIAGAHRFQRPVEAERFSAVPLARRHHSEKTQWRQLIGPVARDGGDPPHAGVVGRPARRLRRQTLE